jgi:hypothetical protein
MNQSRMLSERPLRLAAVIPAATPTPTVPLPAESLRAKQQQAGHPRRDHDEPLHGHLVGPADNRRIIATTTERVNHAECLVAHQAGRGLEPRSSHPARAPPCPKQRFTTVASGHRLRPPRRGCHVRQLAPLVALEDSLAAIPTTPVARVNPSAPGS